MPDPFGDIESSRLNDSSVQRFLARGDGIEKGFLISSSPSFVLLLLGLVVITPLMRETEGEGGVAVDDIEKDYLLFDE